MSRKRRLGYFHTKFIKSKIRNLSSLALYYCCWQAETREILKRLAHDNISLKFAEHREPGIEIHL